MKKEELKKETLEEAAIDYSKMYFSENKKAELGFIAGAKWQQEQDKKMYSEEDMKRAYCNGSDLDYDIMISIIEGSQMLKEWFEKFKTNQSTK